MASSRLPAIFVGRVLELRFLESLIDDVKSGGVSKGAVLSGSPGQGKTALLRLAQQRCDERGFRAIVLRTSGRGVSSPHFPGTHLLSELGVSPHANPVESSIPTLSAVDLAKSLDGYRDAPLAVLVDDAQWIPQEGLETLVSAIRLKRLPTLLVLAIRRAPDDDLTSVLHPTGDLWFQFLELEGLDKASTGELAERLLDGELLPSLANRLHEWTRGNPLFIRELVRQWQAEGALERLGSYWTSEAPFSQGTRNTLHEALAFRLSLLDVNSVRLAQVIALMQRPVHMTELLAIGFSPDDLVSRLELLMQEQIVEELAGSDPTYSLAHPLYGTAALSSASAARRAVLHGAILDGLMKCAASGKTIPAAELASHAVHAPHQFRNIESLVTTAADDAVASGVYSEAARWYGALGTMMRHRQVDASDAMEKQAAATAQFDPASAKALYSVLLEESHSARLHLGRARARRRLGDFTGAMRDLTNALRLSGHDDRFAIRHETAALHGILGDLDTARSLLEELAAESEDHAQTSRAIGHLAQVTYCSGDVEGAYTQATIALGLAVDPEYRLFLKDNLSWYALALGRWQEAYLRLDDALEEAHRSGNLWSLVNLLSNRARLTAWTGRLAEAFDDASRALHVARQLANGAERWSATEALAIAHLESGNPRAALASLTEVIDQPPPPDFPERSRTYALMAELLLSLGSLSDARDFTDEAQRHVQAAAGWQVSIDRVLAAIRLAEGDVEGAIACVDGWLQHPSPLRLDQALLLQAGASAFLLGGQGALAVNTAEQAATIFEELGAQRYQSQVNRWIEDRLHQRKGRPPSQMPWGLTAREIDVLRLLIAGKTDPEIAKTLFLSVGTVKKHVENIKSKVGLRRRVELVGLAPALGLETYMANPQNPR